MTQQSISLGLKPIKHFYDKYDTSIFSCMSATVIEDRSGNFRLKDGRPVYPMDINKSMFKLISE